MCNCEYRGGGFTRAIIPGRGDHIHVCLFARADIARGNSPSRQAACRAAPFLKVSCASRVYENETCRLSLFAYILRGGEKNNMAGPRLKYADAALGDLTWVAV